MFEQYRESLMEEGKRLARYVRVFRLLHERRADRLEELNTAPAFFSTVTDALFSAIVLLVNKLFDKSSQRGLHNFLKFIEYHRPIFSIDAQKRRRGLVDDDWRLSSGVEYGTAERRRLAITEFEALKSFKLRRDKFHAHFDKDYFFFPDREKIAKEAPVQWSDLDGAMELLDEIMNRYSGIYDGQLVHLEPLNISDLNYLLDRLRRAREAD